MIYHYNSHFHNYNESFIAIKENMFEKMGISILLLGSSSDFFQYICILETKSTRHYISFKPCILRNKNKLPLIPSYANCFLYYTYEIDALL